MGKDGINSTFDFDTDPEFNENFIKNIEMAIGTTDVEENELQLTDVKEEEKPEYTLELDNKLIAEEEDSAALELQAEDIAENEIPMEDIDDTLAGINESLAKQISEELDDKDGSNANHKKRLPRWLKIQSGIILTLLCLAGFGFFLGFTKPGNIILMKMGVDLSGKIWAAWTGNFENETNVVPDIDYIDEEDKQSTAPELDPTAVVWPDHPGKGRQEEGVYNILLLGEEAIGSGDGRGRTDVMVIATMNTKKKTLKLTSLMRDMYVQIPGYKDNKLNSAYERGGIDLLYETIALNFGIHLDGCVKVGFENFEKIIDKLGGLELTLTAGEAKYLNTTNYVSNPANRHLVAGKQHMNGNQVLGYARVRKRATITGNNNDYGRTDRHRIVLNAIFEKYKTKSKVDLASVMLSMLPMITTDIDDKNFEMLLNSYIEMGTTEIQQLRIPADGAFNNVKIRGMDCLVPDLAKNRQLLSDFIFGSDSVTTSNVAGDTTENTVTSSVTNSNSNTSN
jgi:polyisoprenyl-teichoic acid--peptidoglycan teichoic acid transferase